MLEEYVLFIFMNCHKVPRLLSDLLSAPQVHSILYTRLGSIDPVRDFKVLPFLFVLHAKSHQFKKPKFLIKVQEHL